MGVISLTGELKLKKHSLSVKLITAVHTVLSTQNPNELESKNARDRRVNPKQTDSVFVTEGWKHEKSSN